jgi:alcohol dehydrogenase class IV
MLPAVVRRNINHAHDKYARMARALGVKTRGMSNAEAVSHVPEKIEELIDQLGLPKHLSQLGVSPDDIPVLAEMAQEDICMLTNPCTYSIQDIEAMYREVW